MPDAPIVTARPSVRAGRSRNRGDGATVLIDETVAEDSSSTQVRNFLKRRELHCCTAHDLPVASRRLRMKVYVDGKFYDEANAKVSVFDHGLLYGDGIFEGIRAYNGRVFKLREHIDRLFYSAKAILLEIPLNHAEAMRAVVETCRENNLRDGYIRLVVTRGVGTLGLNPNRCKNPSVIVIADKIQLYPQEMYERGMAIVTVPTTRNLHNAVNPAIKSLNYLNNILAKIEANIAGVEEAIMLNAEGYVAECTGDNIFILKNGQAFTPPQIGSASCRDRVC